MKGPVVDISRFAWTAAAREWKSRIGFGAVFAIGVVVIFAAIFGGYGRMAVAAIVLAVLVALARLSIQVSIVAIIVFVSFLGDVRRMLLPFLGWSGSDPLLMVTGVMAVLLCGSAIVQGRVKLDTPLAKWTLALNVIMVLQIFNPKQGGLIVGVAGVIFLFVPLLWYWVGRTYATPGLVRFVLYRVVVPIGFIAAVLGTYQVFFGYLPYQEQWLAMNWYPGLGSPDAPAPISLFSSNTEYGAYLVLNVALLGALALRKNPGAAIPILGLLIAIALTGSRGPLVSALAGLVGLWAVLGRSKATWIARGFVAAVVVAVGLVWSLSQASQLDLAPHVQGKIDRQADEFVNRGEGEYSSGATHFGMFLHGYEFAVHEPLGRGLGSTTLAASKFGSGGFTTETNLGDSFVALGLFGGLVYHVMVVLIAVTAAQYWLRTRDTLALALLGIVGVTFSTWLGGGMYAVSTVVLFCIGALDRLNKDVEPASGERPSSERSDESAFRRPNPSPSGFSPSAPSRRAAPLVESRR